MPDGHHASTGIGGMNAAELKKLVRDAIREEFAACGLLATTPAEQVEAQADFIFLRTWRSVYNGIVTKVGSAVILALLGVVGTLLTIGFNVKFGK